MNAPLITGRNDVISQAVAVFPSILKNKHVINLILQEQKHTSRLWVKENSFTNCIYATCLNSIIPYRIFLHRD